MIERGIKMIKTEWYEGKERRKKIAITLISILFIFCTFKIFVGQIIVSFPNISNQHKNRLYSVYLNEKSVSVGIEENKTIINIPYIFKYDIFSSHNYNGDLNYEQLKYKIGDNLKINIESFDCFSKNLNTKISCVGNTSENKIVEAKNIRYEMLIRKTEKGEEIIYKGVLINEIGKYFSEKGSYAIFITARYENVESTVYFNIKME